MARGVLRAWWGSLTLFQLLSTVAVRGCGGGLVGGRDGAWLPRGSSPRPSGTSQSRGNECAVRRAAASRRYSDGDILDVCN